MAKTPKSADKKMKTLLNYFSKTPPVKNDKATVLSPSSEKNTSNIKSTRKIGSARNLNLKFNAGDLVWAKLEGHPWWPSLVYDHPTEGKIWRMNGNSQLVHVQFLGTPPSRGWVKEKFVKPFHGSAAKECQRGGTMFNSGALWKEAVEEADRALNLDLENRLKLAVAMDTSDDEGEENSGVDEKMSLSSEDERKVDKENKTSPTQSPSKSNKRSARKHETKRRRIIESDDDEASNAATPEDSFEIEEESNSSSDQDEMKDEEESSSNNEGGRPMSEDETPSKNRKRKRNVETKSASKTNSSSEGVARVKLNSTKKTSNVKSFSLGSKSMEDKNLKSLNECDVLPSTKMKLSAYSSGNSIKDAASGPTNLLSDERNFPHTGFKFLQPGKIRDATRKMFDDADYNPRTLYVPEDFINKQTPAMKQWWVLKSQYFDTLLFFKMGKFYELFHMDAVIAVGQLGLLFMKGDYAHCGFPERSYGRFSDILVQKGYKVARIEQTETPEQMQERCKQSKLSTKPDKVVKREVCSIQSKGTKKSSFIDGDCCSSQHNFLLAISEKVDGSEFIYGVCFVDVMIGTFHVGQFKDDRHGSRIRTLISHYPPVQVLYEKGKLSERTRNMFNGCLSQAIKEGLKSGIEFWDGSKTLKVLSESDYFVEEDNKEAGVQWPQIFKDVVSQDDNLGLTPREDFALGISALGALIWYLRRCLMDDEILSLKSFEIYTAVDSASSRVDDEESKAPCTTNTNHKMILDGVTLVNLDVLVNSSTGSTEGTLLQRIDSCKTAFGKRLFRQWLCSPLCNISSINDRLNAVDDLLSVPEVTGQVAVLFSKLPDLERLLNKIHTLGSSRRSENHPDSRAVLFENALYNKRKIGDFISCLDGFKNGAVVIHKFEEVSPSFKSVLLKQCTSFNNSQVGKFPVLAKHLEFFDSAFDHQRAKSDGVIKPVEGVNAEFDRAVNDIKTSEEDLKEFLERFKKLLGCKTLTYIGTARNRFQVEVPESMSKKIPDAYELTSQRKGFKRYQNDEIKKLFGCLVDAEERRDAAQKDTMRCIFHQFDKLHQVWSEALQCLSVLDVLISLANYSNQSSGTMCRPEILPCDNEAFLEIIGGRHPCIGLNFSEGDFIPNDTLIGISPDGSTSARVLLVTGPNMGGKSTLMRQVGLICLLAQLGCYVPAQECRLTPVDRIFTRLGASDHIMSGESTFFVELSETSCVLKHATSHSLVLLDELGRGTATYDGNAIASAVLEELADTIKCRTIFSTHYHSIVDRFSSSPRVFLGHMACMVENEDDSDPCQENITFLFKLAPGNCPKSYGFNAAKLAGIPQQVIKEAHWKAKEFEESVEVIRLLRSLWMLKQDDVEELSSLVSKICC